VCRTVVARRISNVVARLPSSKAANRQQRTQQSGLAQPGELELETSRHGAVVLARFSCGSNNRKRGKGAGDSGASV